MNNTTPFHTLSTSDQGKELSRFLRLIGSEWDFEEGKALKIEFRTSNNNADSDRKFVLATIYVQEAPWPSSSTD